MVPSVCCHFQEQESNGHPASLGRASQTMSGATTAITRGYWGLICSLLHLEGPESLSAMCARPVRVVRSMGR